MKEKRQKVFLLFLIILFSVRAVGQEWQEFEKIGYVVYGHPLVLALEDGKAYYYHLNGGILLDDVKGQKIGMTVAVKEGAYGIIRNDGEVIVPFAHDDLHILSGDVIAVKEDNRWGWLDGKTGELLQPCIYTSLQVARTCDVQIHVQQEGKFGLVNKHGNIVIPIESEKNLQFVHAQEDTYILGESKGVHTLYDSLGTVLLEGDYPGLQGIANSHLLAYKKDGNVGLLDPRNGRIVFEPQFSQIVDCVRGLHIMRKKDGKLGVLDEQGKWVLPPEFDDVEFVNADGRVVDGTSVPDSVAPTSPRHIASQAYAAKIDSLPYYMRTHKHTTAGIYDWGGTLLQSASIGSRGWIAPRYYDGMVYFDIVDADGDWCILDSFGRPILNRDSIRLGGQQYDVQAISTDYDLMNRYIPVVLESEKRGESYVNTRVGLFDLKSETMVVEPDTQSIKWLSEDYFEVLSYSKANPQDRIYSSKGKLLSVLERRGLFLSNGLLLVKKSSGIGPSAFTLTDLSGTVIYENPKWRTDGNVAHIRFPDNKRAFSYDFHSGWIKVYSDETNLFVNEKGEEKRFANYDQVGGFFAGHALVANKISLEDENAFRFDGDYYHFGIVDSTGREVFPPEWQSVQAYGNDPYLLVVSKGGKYGLVDRRGKMILNLEYDYIESTTSAAYMQIKRNDKLGLMTPEGRIVIEPGYDEIWKRGKDKETTWPLLVKDGEWYYFVNENGNSYPIKAKQKK